MHRFSKHSTDLGHVTVDPYYTEERCTTGEAATLSSLTSVSSKRTNRSRLINFGGNLRRSYLNWCSPLVVIAKANGRIRLTCNYKRLNKQSNVPVMPLPTVDDL